MAIELWREGKQTVTVEEEVDFEIEKVQDANREAGYRELNQALRANETLLMKLR